MERLHVGEVCPFNFLYVLVTEVSLEGWAKRTFQRTTCDSGILSQHISKHEAEASLALQITQNIPAHEAV